MAKARHKMAKFDVYANPDKSELDTPFFLDLQNSALSELGSRVVAPLRLVNNTGINDAFALSDLHPRLTVLGQTVIMDTPGLGAVPQRALKRAVANVRLERQSIVFALDALFGDY